MLVSRAVAPRQEWTRRLIASLWRTPLPRFEEQLGLRCFSSVWLDVSDDIGRSPDESGQSLDQHRTRILPKAERELERAHQHGSAEAQVQSLRVGNAQWQSSLEADAKGGGNGPSSLRGGEHRLDSQEVAFSPYEEPKTLKTPLLSESYPTKRQVSGRAMSEELQEIGSKGIAAPNLKAWAARKVMEDRARSGGGAKSVKKVQHRGRQQETAREGLRNGEKEGPAGK